VSVAVVAVIRDCDVAKKSQGEMTMVKTAVVDRKTYNVQKGLYSFKGAHCQSAP
jgi:hypothetical protein